MCFHNTRKCIKASCVGLIALQVSKEQKQEYYTFPDHYFSLTYFYFLLKFGLAEYNIRKDVTDLPRLFTTPGSGQMFFSFVRCTALDFKERWHVDYPKRITLREGVFIVKLRNYMYSW